MGHDLKCSSLFASSFTSFLEKLLRLASGQFLFSPTRSMSRLVQFIYVHSALIRFVEQHST